MGAEADATTRLEEGQLFASRYRVKSHLGSGAHGRVYRVFDQTLGEAVALKVLLNSEGELPERFRREVRLARRVSHRNVARTHDLGEEQSLLFLTMEWIDGCSLRELMATAQPTPSELLDIAIQVAEGLAAAHQAGVIHRDLKPENVMVEVSGRAVITDFGIARPCARQGPDAFESLSTVGTPLYMAPEQLEGSNVNPRADLYALGVMLYEMFTGEFPFGTLNTMTAAAERARLEPPDPRALARVSPGLAGVIVACLQPAPSARIASAEQVVAALRRARTGGGGDDATPMRVQVTSAGTLPSRPRARSQNALSVPAIQTWPALAVLPMRYRGDSESDYLGEAVTDELTDLLSATRGLRVFASCATADQPDRDPRRLCAELGVDFLIDGSVQRRGDEVKITARLVDARAGGVQLWSERFAGAFGSLLDLENSVVQRVAEVLRVEVAIHGVTPPPPPSAIDLYLQARGRMISSEWSQAIALLDRCLEEAPQLAVAAAAHAVASVWQWLVADAAGGPAAEAAARASVERASLVADHLAEAGQAAATLAIGSGDYRRAAGTLREILRCAPTAVDAHQELGVIEMASGQVERARRRLRMAADLDPRQIGSLAHLARLAALEGDDDQYRHVVAEIERRGQTSHPISILVQLQVAGWRGDRTRVETLRAHLRPSARHPTEPMLRPLAAALLGELDTAALMALAQPILDAPVSTYLKLITAQLAAEVAARAGETDLALSLIEGAVTRGLIDLLWLDGSPALAPLRTLPAFERERARVAQRGGELS